MDLRNIKIGSSTFTLTPKSSVLNTGGFKVLQNYGFFDDKNKKSQLEELFQLSIQLPKDVILLDKGTLYSCSKHTNRKKENYIFYFRYYGCGMDEGEAAGSYIGTCIGYEFKGYHLKSSYIYNLLEQGIDIATNQVYGKTKNKEFKYGDLEYQKDTFNAPHTKKKLIFVETDSIEALDFIEWSKNQDLFEWNFYLEGSNVRIPDSFSSAYKITKRHFDIKEINDILNIEYVENQPENVESKQIQKLDQINDNLKSYFTYHDSKLNSLSNNFENIRKKIDTNSENINHILVYQDSLDDQLKKIVSKVKNKRRTTTKKESKDKWTNKSKLLISIIVFLIFASSISITYNFLQYEQLIKANLNINEQEETLFKTQQELEKNQSDSNDKSRKIKSNIAGTLNYFPIYKYLKLKESLRYKIIVEKYKISKKNIISNSRQTQFFLPVKGIHYVKQNENIENISKLYYDNLYAEKIDLILLYNELETGKDLKAGTFLFIP